MESTAKMMNASRIVLGGGIPHPFGNPEMSLVEEKAFRRRLLERTFHALRSKVEKTTTFS